MQSCTEPIDVVVLTKNSGQTLERCLSSVYGNVPVRRLIVVDAYSTDQTLEILQRFAVKYGNVEIVFDKGTRSTARQKGIGHVATAWFMFVDSDVVLSRDWFKKAVRYVDGNVGAIWGIEVWSVIRKPAALRMFLLITRKIFDIRGGTHDTLIRSDVVKGIKIPRDLHVFEDAYIKDWIEKKGFRVVACYDPFCLHHRPKDVWTLRGSLSIISDAFRFGSIKLIVKLFLAYGFYTAYSGYQVLTNSLRPH